MELQTKMNPDLKQLAILTDALEALGIRYAIGGSLASSVRGVFRATAGSDLVVDLLEAQVGNLLSALGPGWYGDFDHIVSSLRTGRAFNLVHIGACVKFDLFPATTRFHQLQLQRATRSSLSEEPDAPEFLVTSAEDILLAKLQWFRMGRETSERQWSDILGVIQVQAALDRDYLDEWAAELGVAGLLDKALHEAFQR